MVNNKIEEIKKLLKDFSPIKETTKKNEDSLCEIDYLQNPLNPSLMSYCFDNILGFEVRYRIFEKVNYIIEFDYKGTYGSIGHYKLSYSFNIQKEFKNEVIAIFIQVYALLEEVFLDMAIYSMNNNQFTMENEYAYYFEKFNFYKNKIEKLAQRIENISNKGKNKIKTVKLPKGYTVMYPKYQGILRKIHNEMKYSIESYIDVFYSFLEHVITLLYPFTDCFNITKSYKDYIHNSKWTWDKKITTVFSSQDIINLIEPLRRIKEIFRNRNIHGMFSRELKVYVGIKKFGYYPLYIGKQYLKGFIDDKEVVLDFNKYKECKVVFEEFFNLLDTQYRIPMMFIKSGLPIPVDVSSLVAGVETEEDAENVINRIHYEMDNQNNMDW